MNDKLSLGSSPNLSLAKNSRARLSQRPSHRPTFSNANGGTFHQARREIGRGQNQPNGVPGNTPALHASVIPPMPPMYPVYRTEIALYILPAIAIRSPNDMLSSPLSQHILDYEPPRGFVMPTFAMFDGSSDPYDHMLHYITRK